MPLFPSSVFPIVCPLIFTNTPWHICGLDWQCYEASWCLRMAWPQSVSAYEEATLWSYTVADHYLLWGHTHTVTPQLYRGTDTKWISTMKELTPMNLYRKQEKVPTPQWLYRNGRFSYLRRCPKLKMPKPQNCRTHGAARQARNISHTFLQ